MTIFAWLTAVPWFVLFAYWAVAAVRARRHVRSGGLWKREVGLRVTIIVLVLLLARLRLFGHAAGAPNADPVLGIVGSVLCAAGVALAIWARTILGRNWGLPMSEVEDPVLVTSGPYCQIRHPIYTGFLLAMLGTAIGESLLWAVPLVSFGVYFSYGARREERSMVARFPQAYPAYMRRTKMFVPFVW